MTSLPGTLVVLSHNVTKAMPRIDSDVDLVGLQESDPNKLPVNKPFWEFWAPGPGNVAIGWDTRILKACPREDRVILVNESAQGGDLPFPTPRRVAPRRVFKLRKSAKRFRRKQKVAVYDLWLLNSWDPAGEHDRHTAKRHRMTYAALLRIRADITAMKNKGYKIVVLCDKNRLRSISRVLGLTSYMEHGLDEILGTGFKCINKDTIPAVGVGPTHYHKGLKAVLEY